MARDERHVLGLMSGTSVDAIDAAVVRLGNGTGLPELVEYREVKWDERDRRRLLAAASGEADPFEIARLHAMVGERFAEAAEACARVAGVRIDAVGSHGQTIAHLPATDGRMGATMQIGAAPIIATRLGCVVVHDFRWGDIALGGQGAPLAPAVDALLYRAPGVDRILVNIGGIANVTWLPAGIGVEGVAGFDTGPGNGLLDAWVSSKTDGAERMDRDGRWALRGSVLPDLLSRLWEMPGIASPPPRSLDRSVCVAWGLAVIRDVEPNGDIRDVAATLVEFTAGTIALAVAGQLSVGQGAEVLLSGGGACNPAIVARLVSMLHPRHVSVLGLGGTESDSKEAVAFAVLADAALRGARMGLPAVTGARESALLGSFAFP